MATIASESSHSAGALEPDVAAAAEPVRPAPPRETKAYGQILKSSAVIGGSSAVTMAFGIVRAKAMALMLGPTGVGLMGVFTSVSDLTRSIAEMGINSSGVRQIAESVGSGDEARVARTATVLRRVSVVLGAIGAAILLLFRTQVSQLTFGTEARAGSVALLSLAVLFGLVSDGQGALIQGMRRISDLARMKVLGAVYGTVLSLPIIYVLRDAGVVPSLIAVAGMSIVTSWWYSRKIKVHRPRMTLGQVRHEVVGLFKVGSAFMASAAVMMGGAYFVRVTLLHRLGIEAAGLYQSAWGLAGMYTGFVLQAMGADFYPRLTGVATDNAACNTMVNQQALVSLLLAGPGILGTLTFAPAVIAIFYSARFVAATEVLQWICVGMAMRVIIWPVGFVILAKGAVRIFFLLELAWTVMHVGFVWTTIPLLGLKGAGVAFFASYVLHGFLVYAIVRRLSGFRWSRDNRRHGALFAISIGLVFTGFQVMPRGLAVSVGAVATLLASAYSLRTVFNLVSSDQLPSSVRRLLGRLGLAPVPVPA
jgi:PST family polysaccharide transporter